MRILSAARLQSRHLLKLYSAFDVLMLQGMADTVDEVHIDPL